MSSDGTTAQQADDQHRSVVDVSVPSPRPEHNQQLDTVVRGGTDEAATSQDDNFILDVVRHVKLGVCKYYISPSAPSATCLCRLPQPPARN